MNHDCYVTERQAWIIGSKLEDKAVAILVGTRPVGDSDWRCTFLSLIIAWENYPVAEDPQEQRIAGWRYIGLGQRVQVTSVGDPLCQKRRRRTNIPKQLNLSPRRLKKTTESTILKQQ
jgi:hypothetical protein